MGTSTMGSDLHSDKQDKILKLQARKKELETLLAAKNEELYKLCVQEVQLTGVMPPEAPLSPDVPQRERLGSVRSVGGNSAGDDVRDGLDNASRRLRTCPADRLHDSEQNLRKNISHRLSTPSISGISTKSAPMRHIRRPDANSNYYPSPPQDRSPETFSMHTSHTYPALPTLPSRQESNLPDIVYPESQQNLHRPQTMTTEYMNKIYYTHTPSEAHKISRLRETHFSSSHPDIPTHGSAQPPAPPQHGIRSTPLLYQYASHLKAQSQHLGALGHHHQVLPKRRTEAVRRNTLQRTQTYHLTSHSDYNQHLENLADNYRPQSSYHQENPSDHIHVPLDRVVPNTLPLRERNIPRNLHMQLQVSTDNYKDDCRSYNDALSPISQMSGYSQDIGKFSPLSQESKPKEKQWYETSLDSPTKVEAPMKKNTNLKRTSSIGNSQTYEIMMSLGRNSSLQSPYQPQSPLSPPVLSPSGVSLDSPTNLTVIEQGKCIPYREESKPFEMSDFYKYSTKFRQASAPKPVPTNAYNKLPMELPQYAEQQQWHGY